MNEKNLFTCHSLVFLFNFWLRWSQEIQSQINHFKIQATCVQMIELSITEVTSICGAWSPSG